MEPLRAGDYGCAVWKCLEEHGIPKRLVREEEVESFGEMLEIQPRGECLDFDALRTPWMGTRAKLTSHRFYFFLQSHTLWLSFRLDHVQGVETTTPLFRSPRCVVKLPGGGTLEIKLTKDPSGAQNLTNSLQKAVDRKLWKEGSFEAVRIGGLQHLLESQEARHQGQSATLDTALSDLTSLRQLATQVVAVARNVQRTAKEGDQLKLQQLLQEFGVIKENGSSIVTGGYSPADLDADVLSVCEAALAKRGGYGMLLVHDAFCLVNRARGMALISPDEVMQSLRRLSSKSPSKLRLRTLGSTGALAVCLAATNDADLDAKLVELAEIAPLSSFSLAGKLSITTSEALHLLKDAESRGSLLRDDAPDGVFFYSNFIDDAYREFVDSTGGAQTTGPTAF